MPEGDTVFHTAAKLREALQGKTLTRCDVRVPRYATVDLTGERVDEVVSRGKHLFIRVGEASIHSHLKMDGSWWVTSTDRPSRAGHRIRIILEAGDVQAAGIDLGVLEILERADDEEVVAHLGPDLLGPDWDPLHRAPRLEVVTHRTDVHEAHATLGHLPKGAAHPVVQGTRGRGVRHLRPSRRRGRSAPARRR